MSGLGRRPSSMVSPSPLLGRGDAGAGAADVTGFDDFQLAPADSPGTHGGVIGSSTKQHAASTAAEYEAFGVAAGVDTQTANDPVWLRRAMDAEAGNFLAFVQTAIEEADERPVVELEEQGQEGRQESWIEFEALLRPAENSRVVAAQGFMHILALGTKGVLSVRQERAFGEIWMRVV